MPAIRLKFPWVRRARCPAWEYAPDLPTKDPDRPVPFDPATPEGRAAKVAAMIERRKAGRGLFHPDDAGAAPAALAPVLAEWMMAAVPGVFCVQKATARWRAQPRSARRGGRRVHLGYFATRADACRVVLAWRAAGEPNPPRSAASGE